MRLRNLNSPACVCIGFASKISQTLKFASLTPHSQRLRKREVMRHGDLHIPCVAHFSCESRFPCAWKMPSYWFRPGGVSLWYLTGKVSGVLRLDRRYIIILAKTHKPFSVQTHNNRPQGATLEFKVAAPKAIINEK